MADIARDNGFTESPSKRPRLDRDIFSSISDVQRKIGCDTSEIHTSSIGESGDHILCDVDSTHNSMAFDVDDNVYAAIALGVSSSSDKDVFNGGDSGFNDFIPFSSDECVDPPSNELGSNDCPEKDISKEEPDSSTSQPACNPDVDNSYDDNSENDDVASTVSHLSGLSDFSDMSGQDWKPTAGPMEWVQRHMMMGSNPQILLQQLLPQGTMIPNHLDDMTLWKIIINMVNEIPRRKKLSYINSFNDVIHLLRTCKRIIVLTGAGVSVSCGIPDFRSRDGIYARLARDFPDLPDPQAMFDIQYFRKDPRPFFKFAKEIYPGQFQPSLCHRFIKLLEDDKKLLRNYTQNIDTLEQIAGIENVVECHGSFASATCLNCKYKVDSEAIRENVFNQQIPYCPKCTPNLENMSVMKPDIVFFGEGLPDVFHKAIAKDKDDCDLFIVIGSSLKVRPVALIPSSIHPDVPQILINREKLPHLCFDVELLGDCDVILNEICHRLGKGWDHLCTNNQRLTQIEELPPVPSLSELHLSNSKCNINQEIDESNGKKNSAPCDSTSESGSNGLKDSDSATYNDSDSTKLITHKSSIVQEDNNDPCPIEVSETEDKAKNEERSKGGSLSTLLPVNSFLAYSTNSFIFPGAEVYREYESDSDSLCDNGSGSSVGNSSEDEENDDNSNVVISDECNAKVSLKNLQDEITSKEEEENNIRNNNNNNSE